MLGLAASLTETNRYAKDSSIFPLSENDPPVASVPGNTMIPKFGLGGKRSGFWLMSI